MKYQLLEDLGKGIEVPCKCDAKLVSQLWTIVANNTYVQSY